GHGGHEEPALHLDRVADRRAVRHLRRDQGDGDARAAAYLDRDPGWACDPLHVERGAVQSGEVEEHRGRYALSVKQTAQERQTGDGRELQTADGGGQTADERRIVSLCPLQPAVCCLPSAVLSRLPSLVAPSCVSPGSCG